jgi:hypothetical protein
MPLFADGLKKIRKNLLDAQSGRRPRLDRIGFFTREQLAAINAAREAKGFAALDLYIVFRGKHLYDSRCIADGYSIEEVLEQVQSAFSEGAVVMFTPPSSILRNPIKRVDRNGCLVNDEAVFECTSQHPYAELYSVIPRGDGKKHR